MSSPPKTLLHLVPPVCVLNLRNGLVDSASQQVHAYGIFKSSECLLYLPSLNWFIYLSKLFHVSLDPRILKFKLSTIRPIRSNVYLVYILRTANCSDWSIKFVTLWLVLRLVRFFAIKESDRAGCYVNALLDRALNAWISLWLDWLIEYWFEVDSWWRVLIARFRFEH